MQTLTNSFHKTRTRTRSPLEWSEIAAQADLASFKLPKHRTAADNRVIALRNRIRVALCGIAECTCGTVR